MQPETATEPWRCPECGGAAYRLFNVYGGGFSYLARSCVRCDPHGERLHADLATKRGAS